MDQAELCERMYGIRVNDEPEANDADQYKFDCDKKEKIPKANDQIDDLVNEVEDLLGLGDEGKKNSFSDIIRNAPA